jgi:hypothetical protein
MKPTLGLMMTVPLVPAQFGDMRNFVATYKSERNLFKGQVHISALSIGEAQDKFFDWLKKQSVYPHMWNISVDFVEIGDSL